MDFELIAKYLSGEASPEEEARLTAFRQASAQNEAEFREMVSLWMFSGEIPSGEDAGDLYARHRRFNQLKRHGIRIVRYAAMLLLIAETIVFFVKHAADMSAVETENAIVLRLILFGILCVGILLGFVLEFLTGILARSGEKPFVAEEKRVNY